MILKNGQFRITTENDNNGEIKLSLSDLADFQGRNPKLRTYALAELEPGKEVEYHIHQGECELYYIISGEGIYNDNGEETIVTPGCSTFTPSGNGHGIKNTGKEKLVFIALILLD